MTLRIMQFIVHGPPSITHGTLWLLDYFPKKKDCRRSDSSLFSLHEQHQQFTNNLHSRLLSCLNLPIPPLHQAMANQPHLLRCKGDLLFPSALHPVGYVHQPKKQLINQIDCFGMPVHSGGFVFVGIHQNISVHSARLARTPSRTQRIFA